MIIGMTILIISFIYLLLTGIIYYAKERIENRENKIYNYLLIVNFVGIALEMCCIKFVPKSFIMILILSDILLFIILFISIRVLLTIFLSKIFIKRINKNKNLYKNV